MVPDIKPYSSCVDGLSSSESRGFLLASSFREGFHCGYVRMRGILMEDISD